jgi:hypothetical protein
VQLAWPEDAPIPEVFQPLIDLGYARGYAEGFRESVLKVLEVRRIPVSVEQRQRIAGCKDTARLKDWVGRAVFASTADELFE